MSIERARQALHGLSTDRIPLFDLPAHRGLIRHLTGREPGENPRSLIVETMRRLDIDMGMGWVPPKLEDMSSRPEDWRNKESTSRDIFGYDPGRRTDMCGMSLAGATEQAWREHRDDREQYGDFCLPIGRTFTTCIHYAAEDLDWEEFLIACVAEEERIDGLLDRFQACSEKVVQAWCATDIEVMLTHDDLAMNIGTVLSPDWLRRHILPRYPAIFLPIREKGLPHLFMTDGDFSAIAKDLADLGVGGFFIDAPCVDLEWLVGVAGTDKIYFTGPSPALMVNGSVEQVRAEVKRLADIARDDLPRFFFHLPGGFNSHMPTVNVVAYFDACREFGQR